jgi:hypothetical protein
VNISIQKNACINGPISECSSIMLAVVVVVARREIYDDKMRGKLINEIEIIIN